MGDEVKEEKKPGFDGGGNIAPWSIAWKTSLAYVPTVPVVSGSAIVLSLEHSFAKMSFWYTPEAFSDFIDQAGGIVRQAKTGLVVSGQGGFPAAPTGRDPFRQ